MLCRTVRSECCNYCRSLSNDQRNQRLLTSRRTHLSRKHIKRCYSNVPQLNDTNKAYFDRLCLNKPVEVRMTPDRGRGIFATRDIPKGQTIWKEKPLVAAWHSGNVDYCWTCFIPLEEPVLSIPQDAKTKRDLRLLDEEDLKAEGYKLMQDLDIPRFKKENLIVENEKFNVKFCSASCRTEAYIKYKPLLDAMKLSLPPVVAAAELDEHQRGMFNIMSRILSIQQTKPEFVKDLFSRMMVAPKVVLSGVPYGYYPLLKETFPEAKWFTKSTFWKLRSLIKVNSFYIRSFPASIEVKTEDTETRYMRVVPVSMERFVRSIAIFELGSLFNHSCIPNAVHALHYSYDTKWIATRDIKAGEELLGNYVPLDFPLDQREAILGTNYGFTCECPRCIAERALQQNQQS